MTDLVVTEYPCLECNFKAKSKSGLSAHKRTKHPKKGDKPRSRGSQKQLTHLEIVEIVKEWTINTKKKELAEKYGVSIGNLNTVLKNIRKKNPELLPSKTQDVIDAALKILLS
jgi:hypothetical protein